MITNADMTIYHKSIDPETRLDSYERFPIYGVLWEERKAANVLKSGLESADAVTIYVSLANLSDAPVSHGDVVVRGICDKEITPGYPIQSLKKDNVGAVVTSVDKKDFGSAKMHHYEIGGK